MRAGGKYGRAAPQTGLTMLLTQLNGPSMVPRWGCFFLRGGENDAVQERGEIASRSDHASIFFAISPVGVNESRSKSSGSNW